MSLDLIGISNDDFEAWLHDTSACASGSNLSEERLVELVGTTLRETSPAARARGFIDLANLCHAMADRTLGALAPSGKCLEIVVNVDQRH
jgi:hypothetical protein